MVFFGDKLDGMDVRSSLDIATFRRPRSSENQSGAKTRIDMYGIENGFNEERHVVDPTGRYTTRQTHHKGVTEMLNRTDRKRTIGIAPAFVQAELPERRFVLSVYSCPTPSSPSPSQP